MKPSEFGAKEERTIGTQIARLSVAVCVAGAAAPLCLLAPIPTKTLEMLVVACLLLTGAVPLAGFGLAAWGWRDRVGASVAVSLAVGVAVPSGVWVWWEALQDPKGFDLLFAAVAVPSAQLLTFGAVGCCVAWSAAYQDAGPGVAADGGT